jgi:signal transduction histidine kinase
MVGSASRHTNDRVDILIVEDSPTQAQRLQHILEQQGYQVTHAANGRLALDAAQRRKPALVISDVVMPEMDGYEMCRCLKADISLRDVPVILVTTLSDSGDVIRGLACGADNFILKPYGESYLVSRIQFVLLNRQVRQVDQGELSVEVFFNGQKHAITADRLQILNLLLSTYDAAIQRNKELICAQEELERRAADVAAAKQEAERANRAKSDFLSRMSHDLRTPMNAILGFAQLLDMDSLSPEQHESVRRILKGGAHLLGLINEVLDIARIESGHLSLSPEPVGIGEIVRHVVELVRPLGAPRGIVIEDDSVNVCGDRHLLADRQRLTQILLNLLSNAVKYNRDGGRVRLNCEEMPGRRLRINVSDTGAGIRAERLSLLFQPFERLGAEQTDIEGTGLGLVLSKGLAEAMGGTLGVQSEVDRGSTFWVELALANTAAVTTTTQIREHPHAPEPDPGTTGTVLYIEDNISNRLLMERLLGRRPGIRFLGAGQGQVGLELARADPPDLILLDLHLPDMNGEEVLRRLWEEPRTRAIPVAVLSADATQAHARRLRAAGAIAYLTKPLDVGEVLRLLDDRLTSRTP